MMRHHLLIATTAVLGLAGCSPGHAGTPDSADSGDEPELSREISSFQQEALADDEVTREEYDEAFGNYRSCMEKIGYPLIDVKEVDLQYDYSYSADADAHGAVECYVYEFSQVNGGWSMRPEVAELSPTSDMVRRCLIEHGIAPESTHMARLDQILENNIDIAGCPA